MTNLPAEQGLKAGGATKTDRVMAYPCSSEAQNCHGERHVLRMALESRRACRRRSGNASVEFPSQLVTSRRCSPGRCCTWSTQLCAPGRAVRIERGVNSERGGACKPKSLRLGSMMAVPPPLMVATTDAGIGSSGIRKEHGCQNR